MFLACQVIILRVHFKLISLGSEGSNCCDLRVESFTVPRILAGRGRLEREQGEIWGLARDIGGAGMLSFVLRC